MSLAGIAQENLTLVADGGYLAPAGHRVALRDAVDRAVAGTRLYTPEELAALVAAADHGPGAPRCEVTAETTSAAARRLAADGRIAALNFASGRNPGGGYLRGARAQEEDLARGSALYETLVTQPAYYARNRAFESEIYTDHLIYSPDVPFFRDDTYALLDAPFLCSVLTSPAPNAGAVLERDPDAGPRIARALAHRAETILAVAAAQGHRRLVLGAWGCGVFRNDPAEVAQLFARLLADPRFAGAFDHVTFAIHDRSAGQTTLAAFRRAFPR